MLKKSIPNVLTYTNLSFGVLSILEMIKENYIASAVFILVAALVDRYDGRIARHFDVCSEFGKELDSLADLVSFGIAPALLIFYKFNFLDLGNIKMMGSGFLLLYIICGSSRLAKYNISKFDGVFMGIPITAAGLILALYSLAAPSNTISAHISMIILILLAYFMVSKFEFKKI